MRHRRYGLLLPAIFGIAACSSSPTGPASTTVTLSGTVTATNGGQPLAGLAIDVAGKQTVTNSSGQFALETPSGRLQLMISGSGLVPRVLSVTAGSVATDAITQSNGFDLAFYRQFVRNGFEHPEALEPLDRWTTAPSFQIDTTDERGAPIDPALQATVRDGIAAAVPALTGGRFTASFGGGVPVRFVTTRDGLCGNARIGPVNAFMEIRYLAACNFRRTASHETGHVLGFRHTANADDLMRSGGAATEPSARERYHAAIAYQRPVGNRDPDTDP